jgi:hypothetical protein
MRYSRATGLKRIGGYTGRRDFIGAYAVRILR